jgi:hypothetical protein
LHERGRPLDFHLWTLLSFELWCRAFIDHDAKNLSIVSDAMRGTENREPAVYAGAKSGTYGGPL